jgi:hypothetical protein
MPEHEAVMEWQLRDYRIDPANFDRFVSAWRAGVLPTRRRFGFRVLAWSMPEESRFVWLLGYAGPGSFADADAAYYASAERRAVDPDPGQWVLERRHASVTPEVTQE